MEFDLTNPHYDLLIQAVARHPTYVSNRRTELNAAAKQNSQ